ncbi:MAG: DNA mismatch endonuclease Vsr [Betaproteobacteria bacterium]|jgi:DNA mismatch endonuclease (patch repair protein)
MVDVVDHKTRSRMMAAIRRADTVPETVVRRYLHACGLRFKVQVHELPGTPDIVLPRFKVVVLVHGCFWHRHSGCRFAAVPASRKEFWSRKFDGNVRRDAQKSEVLEAMGWRPLVIWECETRDAEQLDQLFWRIVST